MRPGLWEGRWNDAYAAERMLLPERCDELRVAGDLVAFLPGTEVVYFVASADDEAMERALALVDERLTEPRALLDLAFVRRSRRRSPSRGTTGSSR